MPAIVTSLLWQPITSEYIVRRSTFSPLAVSSGIRSRATAQDLASCAVFRTDGEPEFLLKLRTKCFSFHELGRTVKCLRLA